MGCPSKQLVEGMEVEVDDPAGEDTHNHAFSGTIAAIHDDGTVTVRDQEDVEFTVGNARVHPVED